MGRDPPLGAGKVALHLLYVLRAHGPSVGPLHIPEHLFIPLHRVMVALQGIPGVLVGDPGIQLPGPLCQHTTQICIGGADGLRCAGDHLPHTPVIKGWDECPALLRVRKQAAVGPCLPPYIVHGLRVAGGALGKGGALCAGLLCGLCGGLCPDFRGVANDLEASKRPAAPIGRRRGACLHRASFFAACSDFGGIANYLKSA